MEYDDRRGEEENNQATVYPKLEKKQGNMESPR